MRMITHSYDTYDEAVRAVNSLEAAGIPHDDISVVSGDKDRTVATDVVEDTAAAGTGATIGTVLGGGAGLLAGLGALAIPGVGPVVAAGWLIATLTGAGVGAAAGGLVGSLANSGVDEADAGRYAEHVGRGGTLVTVRASDDQAADAEYILEHGAPRGESTLAANAALGTGMTTAGLASDSASMGAFDPIVAPAAAMPMSPVVAPMPLSTAETRPDQVSLREEQVGTDRRPLNRPLSGWAADDFRDRSVSSRSAFPETTVPSGTPAGGNTVRDNPVTRAVDRTLDTNTSGENPKV